MASRRRKRPLPVRLSNEEQEDRAWNMADLIRHDGIAKPSSLFQVEVPCSSGLENFPAVMKEDTIPKKKRKFPRKSEADFDDIVELKLQSSLPESWHCHIGTFRVNFNNNRSCTSTVKSDYLDSLRNEKASSSVNLVEVKVTLNLESIVDNEMGCDFITSGGPSSIKSLLPSALRNLSMKGVTAVPPDTLEALENLQKKGLVSLVVHSKTSVFDNSWDVKVCLCESALTKMKFASEDVRIRNIDKLIQNLMEFFVKDICNTGSQGFICNNKQMEFSSLYETVMKRRKDKGRMTNVNTRTFVAGNKSGKKLCKFEESCASKLKMNGQITNGCHIQENEKKLEIKPNYHSEQYFKDLFLDGELQSEQNSIIQKDEHLNTMEIQPLESCIDKVSDVSSSKILCDFQHEHLKPTLRQYQRKAVKWMTDKENGTFSKNVSQDNDFHFLWRRCVTLDKKVIFFNPYNGRLTTEHFTSPVPPPGGILADEMGLGKTVEVLACILNNPMPGDGVQIGHKDVNKLQAGSIVASAPSPTTALCNPSETTDDRIAHKTELLSNKTDQLLSPLTASLSTASYTTAPKLLPPVTSELPFTDTVSTTFMFATTLSATTPATLSTLSSTLPPPIPISSSTSTTLSTLSSTLPPPIPISSSTSTTLSTLSSILPTPMPISSSTSAILSTPIPISSSTSTTLSTLSSTLPPPIPISLPITPQILDKEPSVPLSLASVVTSSPSLQITSCIAPSLVCESVPLTSSSTSPTCTLSQLSSVLCRRNVSLAATSLGNEKLEMAVTLLERNNAPTRMSDARKLYISEENQPLKSSENLTDSACSVTQDGLQSSHNFDAGELALTATNIKTRQAPTILGNRYLIGKSCSAFADKNNHPPSMLNIKCICGNTQSVVADVLLKCSECSAVSHASCLGYTGTDEQSDTFLCPNCAVNRSPIPSRATLIISPATIAHQWVEEITRHTTPSALRLLVYEGVAKQGFVQPDMIADHDVVLTTYATLRADFNHLGTQQGRSLRYQKRYIALPSPLTAIKFWRICLDEAQMVESTTAKAAEMALRLDCVNRWCVTGTPIQKGLEDLYGLLLFLGVFPYCQRVWWNKLLYEPYLRGDKEPMYDALADILWRTAKKNVLDEIQLPSQTEIVVRLNFTPVEEHFYRRQQEECSASIHLMLRRFGSSDIKLNSLDRNTVHRMLIPLLRLRQACCHPQVVRGGFLSMQKSTMTMDQLLEVLITRAKLECEEAHRQLLFAINGLAGIHAIREEWSEAVDLYRESMRSWMEHEDKFRTDALQKLHTLHNLSDLLSSAYPGCSHTLRDDKLKDEAEELVKQYMTKPNTQVQAALDNLKVAEQNIEELLKKVQFHSPWWLLAVDSVESSGLGPEFINRVKEELSSMSIENGSILNSFSDMRGLGYTMTTKLDVVESTHSTLAQALNQLRTYPTPEVVHATAVCCLRSRPQKTSQATKCKFCYVDDIFTEYESRLFGHQGMKGINMEEDANNTDWHRHGNTGGLRAETETEKVLKTLFAFIKSQRLVPSIQQDARSHLAFMESRRKEFKFLRGAWFALRERVSALDELEMCTTKIRLALPGEDVNEDEKHVIHRGQVEQQKLKFLSDRVIARTELRKKLGQYLYLTNLAKSQKFSEGQNPDPCPVCTRQLGKEWSVFSCGHCYCCQCVWVLLRQAGIGPRNRDVHIKCPICRLPTLAREISYVCTGKDGNHGDKNVLVKGSHSTKVEAVVRALLKIKAEDDMEKTLVFSTWQDVLELIGKALQENDISFRHITCGGKRFQTDLHVFKDDPNVSVLLLPLQSGSNGLNIIEATHVLLVEPALNPAHELQAVGRVHRIGQTRPTFVHRFIINNTVESRMYSLLNGKSREVVRTGSKDTENSTLTIADLTSLFKEENDPKQMQHYSDDQDDIEMIT